MNNKEQILKKVIEKAVNNGYKYKFIYEENQNVPMFMLISGIIFSHDFAISFYGKDWKKRLKEQVLEVNPLNYIEEYLD